MFGMLGFDIATTYSWCFSRHLYFKNFKGTESILENKTLESGMALSVQFICEINDWGEAIRKIIFLEKNQLTVMLLSCRVPCTRSGMLNAKSKYRKNILQICTEADKTRSQRSSVSYPYLLCSWHSIATPLDAEEVGHVSYCITSPHMRHIAAVDFFNLLQPHYQRCIVICNCSGVLNLYTSVINILKANYSS